jgi:hypothetical protein
MRLLPLTISQIDEVVKEMEQEAKAIKKEIFKLAWFMRGSLSIDEAYQLTYEDREVISDIIKENLDMTKETGLPFF